MSKSSLYILEFTVLVNNKCLGSPNLSFPCDTGDETSLEVSVFVAPFMK